MTVKEQKQIVFAQKFLMDNLPNKHIMIVVVDEQRDGAVSDCETTIASTFENNLHGWVTGLQVAQLASDYHAKKIIEGT